MRAPERRGAIPAAFEGVDQGRQPVRHIQRRRLARQQVIAQGAQDLGQVAEQLLAGGIDLNRVVGAGQGHTGGDGVNACGAALEWISGGR